VTLCKRRPPSTFEIARSECRRHGESGRRHARAGSARLPAARRLQPSDRIMVPLCRRTILVTGLTAALLFSCAGSAAARRLPSRPTARPSHVAATCARPQNRRRPPAIGRRRLVRLRHARSAKVARSVVATPGGVVSQSMLRPSGTAADLSPMPQLLDLDDRKRDMRSSARMLHRMAAPR
jgi:hypothetical protein